VVLDHIDAVGRRLWSRVLLDVKKENRRKPAAVSNVIRFDAMR